MSNNCSYNYSNPNFQSLALSRARALSQLMVWHVKERSIELTELYN